MRSLEYIIRFPTRLLVKLCFGHFGIFLKFYSLFKIFAPQKPPKKIITGLWKGVPSGKFTFTVFNTCYVFWQNCYISFFYHISEYHWRNVQFLRCFLPKKGKKISSKHPLNLLAPFRVYNKTPTELLVKLCFGNFRIFLKFCSHFQIFAT